MSSQSATLDPAANGVQDMDEVQLTQAMKRLKLLHIKARMLRNTIIRMLDPLVQKHSSPDVLYKAFVQAVNDAQVDVQEFAALMKDATSKKIFAHATKSRDGDPLNIPQWQHTDHPKWFNMDED